MEPTFPGRVLKSAIQPKTIYGLVSFTLTHEANLFIVLPIKGNVLSHQAILYVWCRGAVYSSAAYIQQTKALTEFYRVDGVATFQHIGCRQYNAWVKKAKEVIEKELGIPALVWKETIAIPETTMHNK